MGIQFNSFNLPELYLSKVNLSWIFEELDGEKLIPKTVYSEVVVEGKKRGEVDAFIVDELVNNVFEVVEITPVKPLENIKELHRGEVEVLSLAKARGGIAITDDSIAREIGEALGVKVHGTLYLIFLMLKKDKIGNNVAVSKVNEMIRKGFRLSVEVYSEFLKLAGVL